MFIFFELAASSIRSLLKPYVYLMSRIFQIQTMHCTTTTLRCPNPNTTYMGRKDGPFEIVMHWNGSIVDAWAMTQAIQWFGANSISQECRQKKMRQTPEKRLHTDTSVIWAVLVLVSILFYVWTFAQNGICLGGRPKAECIWLLFMNWKSFSVHCSYRMACLWYQFVSFSFSKPWNWAHIWYRPFEITCATLVTHTSEYSTSHNYFLGVHNFVVVVSVEHSTTLHKKSFKWCSLEAPLRVFTC